MVFFLIKNMFYSFVPLNLIKSELFNNLSYISKKIKKNFIKNKLLLNIGVYMYVYVTNL